MKQTLFTVALTGLVSIADAQTPAAPAAPTTGAAPAPATAAAAATPAPKPLSLQDKKLLKDISESILLAQKYLKTFSDAKPTVSESLQRDMGKVGGELRRAWTAISKLATARGAQLATEASKSDASRIDRLAKEKPDKFVKEYFKEFNKDMAKLTKVIDSARTVQDPEVKIFVEDWGTILKNPERTAQAGEKAANAKK